jgi:hypothetical protein
VIYYDNHSCIKLSKNLVFCDRSKHIDILVSSSTRLCGEVDYVVAVHFNKGT